MPSVPTGIERAKCAGYSARVTLQLSIPGSDPLDLAQIAHDRLIFDRPVVLGDSIGVVTATIDGVERRWTARVQGSAAMRRVVPATLTVQPAPQSIAR